MKRFGKLMITGLLVGGLLVPMAGCANNQTPFVPPESEGGKVTINDAYDWNDDKTGSTRPDLGGDYEAVLPPTEVTVTLAESTTVRFKGGETSFRLPIGKTLKASDFDESTLGGRTVDGFAVVGAEGEIRDFSTLKDFAPLEAVTVTPYFAPEKGEAVLFGTKEIGDYYYDGEGKELDDIEEYALAVENAVIEGLMGRIITCESTLSKNSYFRSVTVLEREDGQSYAYYYTFKNCGESAVAFTVYQMHSGHKWQDNTTCVASTPVTLEAGASKAVEISVEKNVKNDANSLTLIKFDGETAGFKLGVAMARENTTPTEPATITLNLPEGITVTGYETNVNTNDKLYLPTAAQINNESGHKIIGWVYSVDRTPVVEGVRIKGDIAIEPVLTEDIKIEFFNLPEGFSVKSDYSFVQQSGDKLLLPTSEQIENTTGHRVLYWVDENGARVAAGTILTDNIKITPVFTRDVTITLELPEGFTVSGDYVTAVQTGDKLVLPTKDQITNETEHKFIRWVDGDGNVVKDGMTLNGDITLKPELSQSATITLQLPEGFTVSSDYVTAVQTGDKLVAPTSGQVSGTAPDGRELLGWYVVGGGNEIIGANTIIMEREVTIAPYFSRRAGTATMCNYGDDRDGKPLVFNNNQSNLKPLGFYNADGTDHSKDDFEATTDKWNNTTPVGGGENGYAELGNYIKYNGTITAGMAFRAAAMVSNNDGGTAVVKKNVPHTFYYNFENLGNGDIHLTVQGVNSGANVEGPVSSIDLRPGESVMVSFTVTYTKGDPNKNVIAYFKAIQDIVDMKLGVSVNVVLESATVTLKSGVEGVTLADSYVNTIRHRGEKLVLPAEGEYTNTSDKKLIGWKDASGNALTNDTVISGDIELVPVFAEPITVTFELPEEVTFKGFDLVHNYTQTDTLTLPTDEQINNTTGRAILYWTIKDTATRVDDGMVLTESITVVPVFEKEAVTLTLAEVEGFEVSAEYFAATQYKGGLLVLPTEAQITNNTGKELIGWTDENGAELTAETPINGDITLTPVLVKKINITVSLPAGLTIAEDYKTQALEGDKLVIPAVTENTTGMGAPAGWFNTEAIETVTADTELTEDITIAPYWQTKEGYTYVQLGSGANSGYNTDQVPGDVMKYAGTTDLKHYGYTSGNASTRDGDAQLLYGGDYTLLGSVLTLNKPVQAGSAIRFDSKRTLNTNGNYEFIYTVENKGTTDLLLSIYQINASSEYKKTTYYGYESRYRTEIRVAAGNSVTAIGQYSLDSNSGGNMMTYIVFEEDVDSFSFGISVGYKKIDAIGEDYKNQPALVNPAEINYNPADNGGIVVKDSYLKQRAGRFALAPTAEDFENPDNVAIEKWQIVINGTAYDLPASTASYTDVLIPSKGATLKVVLAQTVNIAFRADNGVSVDGAKTSYNTGDKLELPAVTASTTDGRKHVGWFNTATGAVVTNDTVVEGAMTLAPYFEPATGTALTPLDGATSSDAYGPDNISMSNTGKFTKETNVVSGDELGIKLTYSGAVKANDHFRFKTSFTIGVNTYKYTYKFTNYGKSEIKFTVYQLEGGTTTTGMPSQEVTLAAGESVTIDLTKTYTDPNGNKNSLTYFVMGCDVAAGGFALGVAESVEEVTAQG